MTVGIAKSKKRPRSRFLRNARISDYHFDRILVSFASGLSAAEAQRQIRLSYVTVRKHYSLIRRRLIEIGYFTSLEKRLRDAGAEDDTDALERDLDVIDAQLRRRRGTRKKRAEHIAELLFRLDDQRPLRSPRRNHRLAWDMRKALLLSGPINRPLTVDGLALATNYLLRKTLEQRLVEVLDRLESDWPDFLEFLEKNRYEGEN